MEKSLKKLNNYCFRWRTVQKLLHVMMKTILAVVLLLLGFSAQGLFEYKLVLSSNHGLSTSIFARVLRQKRFHFWKIIVTPDSSAKLTWNKRFIRYFEIGILDLYVIWTLGLILLYSYYYLDIVVFPRWGL